MLLARAILAIAFLLVPISSKADCIGCFDVVKVRAEFRDGTSRDMYFVHYPASSPLHPDSDSALVVPLELYDTSHYFNGNVPLLKSIYQFDDITTATTQADIDSIDVSTLTRLVYLQDMKFGAWGTINVYSPRVIELLGKAPTARYEYERGGSFCVLLAYDPRVTVTDLASLVEVRRWRRDLNEVLRRNVEVLYKQREPVISEDDIERSLDRQRNALYEHLYTLDTLVKAGPVGEYLGKIRGRIVSLLDYMKAVQSRFEYDHYSTGSAAVIVLNRILRSSGCDTSGTSRFVSNGNVDSLLVQLAQCQSIWTAVERDDIEFFESTDIVEVFNESD